ncbi:MAG: signal peptidase II [Chloroflexota bacterium]|nr:signal peptidase II [Chloroflexota bacterium]
MSQAAGHRRWLAFGVIAATVWLADQVSKAWIAANFGPSAPGAPGAGAPTPVVGDFVRISVTHNTGGIFGLFGGSAAVLALASIFVVGLIIVYQARQGVRSHWLLTVALALLLGGALGNLTDRLRFGYVLDFVDVGIGDVRWYTFNVADAAISSALVLLVLITVLGDRLPGSSPHRSPRTVADTVGEGQRG